MLLLLHISVHLTAMRFTMRYYNIELYIYPEFKFSGHSYIIATIWPISMKFGMDH